MIKRTNTFEFNEKSILENKTYEGRFTVRLATFADKQKISVRQSQLCGGMYCVRDDEGVPTGRGIAYTTEFNCRMIAWLETVVIQAPGWFKDMLDPDAGLLDEDIIFKLFAEVSKFEKRFRPDNGTTAEGAEGSAQGGEGTGAPQSAPSNDGNPAPKVVGREVPAALDP